MVDAEEVKNGGMQVIDANPVFHGLVPKFVTRTVVGPTLDTSSSHPHGEGIGIVVPALPALGVRGSAEFTTPHHKGVVQHPP